MANKGNYLPLKLYKKLLVESYLQNCEDGDRIKEYLIKNHDPILQLEDRYIPPRPKGYILTEKYIRKMAEKPEKNHMRRIPMKNSMSSGCIVISENRKKQGIKMHPQKRTNQDSTKSSVVSDAQGSSIFTSEHKDQSKSRKNIIIIAIVAIICLAAIAGAMLYFNGGFFNDKEPIHIVNTTFKNILYN